jgi:hypothetical protein
MAAIPVCLVGLLVGVLGSGTFLHAFGSDPFLVVAPPMPTRTLGGAPTVDFKLPGMLTDLRLSPGGKRVALMKYTGGAARYLSHFSVGVPGSAFTPIAAADFVFLDDERALAMTVDATRTRLQEIALGSNAVTWDFWIDNLSGPRLMYRRASNHFVVTGIDVEARMVSVEGAVGGGTTRRREWNVMDREEALNALAIDGDTALRSQRTFGFDPIRGGALNLTMAAMFDQMETRLTRVTPNGETPVAVSRLDTICTDHAFDGERLVCMAYDGSRTHVFAFAPAGEAPQPIGSLGGRFLTSRPTREGWLSGWMMTSGGAVSMSSQVAIDLAARRIVAVPREMRAEEITVAGQVAGTVTHDASSTRVRLYSLLQ